MKMNKEPMPFFPLVERLQKAVGNTKDIMHLLDLVDKKSFLKIRTEIINIFEIGTLPEFDGRFGVEVELGDISDAVIGVTLNTYPQSTPMDEPISFEQRKAWCVRIIELMDKSVQN